MKSKLFYIVIGASALEVSAVGIGFEYASAKVSAHGNTGVTNLGSASAVQYNPGALSFLEEGQVEVNTFSIFGDAEWTTPGGDTFEVDDSPVFTGTAYISYPVDVGLGKGVVGLGLTSSYGQSVSWPSLTPARDAGFEGSLRLAQYQLSYSHQITDSLGLGVTWNWVDSELESTAGGGTAFPADEAIFDGSGSANFFQFGLLYQPSSDWSLGIAYRSSFDLEHEGSFRFRSNFPGGPNFDLDASTEFELPPHVILGFSYTGVENLTISLQSQWTGWSTFDEFEVITELGPNTSVADWDDGWIHSIGASYQLNECFSVHAGYVYVESIIPDENQILTIADFDQHLLSTGVSYETDRWGVDLALVYTVTEDIEIEQSNFGLEGEHDNSALFVNLGGRWKY